MIIQIRGTSGSGKTTVMREILDKIGATPRYRFDLFPSRKAPLYYEAAKLDTVVLGHYQSACGGCDNIGSAAKVFELMAQLRDIEGEGVWPGKIIAEGLLLSEDTKWTLQMPRDGLRVVYLTTDVEECLRRIRERRRKAGNDKPLKEDNTRNRVAVIERSRVKLTEAGVTCIRASSKQAAGTILKWLGYTPTGRKNDGPRTSLAHNQDHRGR